MYKNSKKVEVTDYSVIYKSALITLIVTFLTAGCIALADKVSRPLMAAGGMSQGEIEASIQSTFLEQHMASILLMGPIVLFVVVYLLWRFLNSSEFTGGILTLPKKEISIEEAEQNKKGNKILIIVLLLGMLFVLLPGFRILLAIATIMLIAVKVVLRKKPISTP